MDSLTLDQFAVFATVVVTAGRLRIGGVAR